MLVSWCILVLCYSSLWKHVYFLAQRSAQKVTLVRTYKMAHEKLSPISLLMSCQWDLMGLDEFRVWMVNWWAIPFALSSLQWFSGLHLGLQYGRTVMMTYVICHVPPPILVLHWRWVCEALLWGVAVPNPTPFPAVRGTDTHAGIVSDHYQPMETHRDVWRPSGVWGTPPVVHLPPDAELEKEEDALVHNFSFPILSPNHPLAWKNQFPMVLFQCWVTNTPRMRKLIGWGPELSPMAAQSCPVLQRWCNCANRVCAAFCSGKAITEVSSRYGKMCSLTLGCIGARKLDKVRSQVYKKFLFVCRLGSELKLVTQEKCRTLKCIGCWQKVGHR